MPKVNSLFINLKAKMILGFIEPTDILYGDIHYRQIMNPEVSLVDGCVSQYKWFDNDSHILLKEVEVLKDVGDLRVIRSRNSVTDKFIKYTITIEDALMKFLIIA